MPPVDEKFLKTKIHISRKITLRLLLFVLVVGGAVVFDLCHDQLPQELMKQQQDASEHQVIPAQVYFCNPGSSFKVRSGSDRLCSKILFSIGQDKFLTAFHNHITYHLLKVESLKERSPQKPMVHFRKFVICHHSNTDDVPLIA